MLTIKDLQSHYVYIEDLPAQYDLSRYFYFGPSNIKLPSDINVMTATEQCELVLAMVSWLTRYESQGEKDWRQVHLVAIITRKLLRRKLPFAQEDVIALLQWAASLGAPYFASIPYMIQIIENFLKKNPLIPELQKVIARLAKLLDEYFEDQGWGFSRDVVRLRVLGNLQATPVPLESGEAWSDVAIHTIEALSDEIKKRWMDLLAHCQKASGTTPSQKWQKTAVGYQQTIGYAQFKKTVCTWFALVDKPRTQPLPLRPWGPDPNYLLNTSNADVLRGLIWLCGGQEDEELARSITAVALSAYRKVPGIGPRSVKLGNACVWVLGKMPGIAGVSQLAILKTKVKFGTAQKGIEKALVAAAEREGLSRDEIEEIVVPAYSLEEVGVRREEWGDYTAVLEITGTTSTELRWLRADGKPQKAVPKAVKDNFPEEYKELQQTAKDIQRMIPAQRERIEKLYLAQKQWPYPTWQERYNDHPLIGTLARRLIWNFKQDEQTETGIWHNGRIISYNDVPLDWLSNETTVELWHPIHGTTETILAWRRWLEMHEIQQPFKQAHRELYLLTDAERNTGNYSNRFAAHIIRQHQFNALAAARGWKNKLRLMVDDDYPPPSCDLPAWGIRAEFWVEGAGDEYGIDTNETGTFLYLTTDQVCFYALDTPEHRAHASGGGYYTGRFGYRGPGEPIPLEEVPAFVFTEIMRDVDLFVGVGSVGNDPTWQDGGPNGRYQNYWATYSFGDLSQTAETRKQVLERIIPRLKIAAQCEIDGRFLTVHGHLRTYKIHLGSGNILMSPHDQYLCIVPSSSHNQTGTIYLPFEGDRTLAIILSKAFLLADDDRITDRAITRQIKS